MVKNEVSLPGFEVEVAEVEESMPTETVDTDVHEDVPQYGSKQWSDYVLSLLEPDEIFNGNPLSHGLRRLSNLLLGSIISSRPVEVFPSMDPNGVGRATVVYEIQIDWQDSGQIRVFGDVAEVWHGNTDDLFSASASATACTKAEGRCLRKALMVKCVAADELTAKDAAAIVRSTVGVKIEPKTTGEMKGTDKISTAQEKFLEAKCRQLDIDVYKFVNMGDNKYEKITDIDKLTASIMIQTLNSYQTKEKDCPESIKGFVKEWKNL
jgi:hypothetical protein